MLSCASCMCGWHGCVQKYVRSSLFGISPACGAAASSTINAVARPEHVGKSASDFPYQPIRHRHQNRIRICYRHLQFNHFKP